MHCRDGGTGMQPQERQMNVIEMKMHNVELRYSVKDVIEHQHYERQRVLTRLIEPERRWAGRNQSSACDGIAAGEECNLMSLPDKFFREIRDDALSSAVQDRGHTLDQG